MFNRNRNKLFALSFSFLLFLPPFATASNTINQLFDAKLYQQLPEKIKEKKQLIAVNDGHVPPYVIYSETGEISGAAVDLFEAISQILGVSITHEKTTNISAMLLGVQSGRYDFALGPITDLPTRQQQNDFIAYAASYIAFAVQIGNPHNIHSIADSCGKRMAAVSGAQGVELLTNYSKTCEVEGKPAVNIMIFKDQPSAILALKSGRTDAFLAGISILAHYVSNGKDKIELAGIKDVGSAPERYHSSVVAKESPLGPIILEALQQLFDNGSYATIMKKWGLESAMLKEPGINLAK